MACDKWHVLICSANTYTKFLQKSKNCGTEQNRRSVVSMTSHNRQRDCCKVGG